MEQFNFCASVVFNHVSFEDVETFVASFPDFQTVVLEDELELQSLSELLVIDSFANLKPQETDFVKYWDISESKLPVLNEEEFSNLYDKWLNITGRVGNMDEFGNLIFLQGITKEWNRMKFRFIVKEK